MKYCTIKLNGPRTRRTRRLEKILSDEINARMKKDARFQRELIKFQQQQSDRLLRGAGDGGW